MTIWIGIPKAPVIRALKFCWLCWRGLCCTLGLHWHVHYVEPFSLECDCGHRKAL